MGEKGFMDISDGLKEKLERLRLLVLDVDGVLTDGSIWLGEDEEFKRFDVRDGSGIKFLLRFGVDVAILSGRSSVAVRRRAAELGVSECLQGCLRKLPAYLSLIERLGIDEEFVGCMGDDLHDLPLFNHCGVRFAVCDAVPEVKERADIVTESRGGCGAVREVAEIILKAKGKWRSLVEGYIVQ